MRALGELVREYRRRIPGPPTRSNRWGPGHGSLSQLQLAQRAGIDAAYVCRIERGQQSRPSREVVAALARELKLTTGERAQLMLAAGYSTGRAS